jgi:hypothetical protein
VRTYRCEWCAYRGRRTAAGLCPSCLSPLAADHDPLSRRAVLTLQALRLGFVMRHDPQRRSHLGHYWLTVPPGGVLTGKLAEGEDNLLRRIGLRQATVHTATVAALERRGWLKRRRQPKSSVEILTLNVKREVNAKSSETAGLLGG